MSGLVGIASNDAVTPITAAELDALGETYQLLRGAGSCERALAGSAAGVIRITAPAVSDPPRSTSGESWVLCCGTPHDPMQTGGEDVEQLDGQFVWSHYDAARGEPGVA